LPILTIVRQAIDDADQFSGAAAGLVAAAVRAVKYRHSSFPRPEAHGFQPREQGLSHNYYTSQRRIADQVALAARAFGSAAAHLLKKSRIDRLS
jgi:hypothetical protein